MWNGLMDNVVNAPHDPINFLELNANIYKMANDTNLKFGRRAPKDSPDMTPIILLLTSKITKKRLN